MVNSAYTFMNRSTHSGTLLATYLLQMINIDDDLELPLKYSNAQIHYL